MKNNNQDKEEKRISDFINLEIKLQSGPVGVTDVDRNFCKVDPLKSHR